MYAKGLVDGVDDDGGEGAKGGKGTIARHERRGGLRSRPGGGFGGKRHGPRTRKRDSRKLKGGHGRLVVFKKTICGLEIRPIYYVATAHGWWEIARSIASSPFVRRGLTDEGPVGHLYPRRSFLAAELSLPRVMPDRGEGGLLLPHHRTGKCVSCVARCSFADGTIYSRGIVVFKYPLLPRERTLTEFLPPLIFSPLSPFSLSRVSPSSFLPRRASPLFLPDFFIPPFCRTRLIHLPLSQLPQGPNPP